MSVGLRVEMGCRISGQALVRKSVPAIATVSESSMRYSGATVSRSRGARGLGFRALGFHGGSLLLGSCNFWGVEDSRLQCWALSWF